MLEKSLFFVFKALLHLLALLPLKLSRLLACYIGLLVWKINKKSHKIRQRNIDLCYPEMTAAEKDQLVKDSIIDKVKLIFELSGTWLWSIEKCQANIKTVENADLLEHYFNQKKGVIIALPHLGNWEMMAAYLADRYPVTALYKPPKQKVVEEYILNSRQRYSITMAPTNIKGVIKLVKALKRGEVVVILPDQIPDQSNGFIDVPFMNIPTRTMLLIYKLYQKTSAHVLLSAAVRQPEGYDVIFRSFDSKIYDDNPDVSVTAMNSGIADLVNDYPEQYQWEYNRFKYYQGET
jgi:Kdo2-lipid IVA lauroyltransferase/acyltransferase